MNHLTKCNLRIVHIDDNDDFVHISGAFLKFAGFEQPVVQFNCGKKALAYLSTVEPARAPHVIILDLGMPGMSGWEVLRWVRESYRDRKVPVYILTSEENPEIRRQAIRAGATEYHYKTDLFHDLVCDLEHEMVIYNHKHLQELKELGEIMAELALQAEGWPEMVVLTDVDGRVEWVNEAFVDTCGYTLDELRGKKPGHLLQGPGSDAAAIQRLHDAVHGVRACECRIVNYRKNGMPYPVSISLGPVYSQGAHRGFLAVEQDLSEAATPAAHAAGSNGAEVLRTAASAEARSVAAL